jgi:hypothetical protein
MIETIVRAIEPELGGAEQGARAASRPAATRCLELFQRGLWHHYRFTKDDNAELSAAFFRRSSSIPRSPCPSRRLPRLLLERLVRLCG